MNKNKGTLGRKRRDIPSEKDSFDEMEDKYNQKKTPESLKNKNKNISRIKNKPSLYSDKESILDCFGTDENNDQILKSRINSKAIAENMKRIKENSLNLNNKKKEEIILDGEVEELKKELDVIESKIKKIKKHKLKKKLKKSKVSTKQKAVNEILKKQDREIKKYKEAYNNLLSRWEKAMLENDPKFQPRVNERKYKLKFKSPEKMASSILSDKKIGRVPDFDRTTGNEYIDRYISKISDIESESNIDMLKSSIAHRIQAYPGSTSLKRPSSSFKRAPVGSSYFPNARDYTRNMLRRPGSSAILPSRTPLANSMIIPDGANIPRARVFVGNPGSVANSRYFTPKKGLRDSGMRDSMLNRSSYKAVDQALSDYKAGNSQFQRKLDELRRSRFG